MACRGTLGLLSPEVCRLLYYNSTESLSEKVDVWSMGLTLIELWEGASPWNKLWDKYCLRCPNVKRPSQVQEETDWFAERIARTTAKLDGAIPAPGKNNCWDSLQTQHELVTRIVQACCHPDPLGRPSAACVAEMLLQKLQETEAEISAQDDIWLRM